MRAEFVEVETGRQVPLFGAASRFIESVVGVLPPKAEAAAHGFTSASFRLNFKRNRVVGVDPTSR